MFELKKLSPEGIERAMKKVERYRLLNEPWEAESICRDVLDFDPDHQEALVALLLSLTDQFSREGGASVEDARSLLDRLASAYHRAYYAGIICERKGTSLLKRSAKGSGPLVYDWLRKAMAHYDAAAEERPPGNDDALVRWNTCARLIMRHDALKAVADEQRVTFLE